MDTTPARPGVVRAAAAPRSTDRFVPLALAAFVGFNLRGTVLGLPPLLGRVGGDLGLGHSAEGVLTALPVLLFGIAAIPGARVARHLGGRNTVVLGLSLTVLGTLVRSLDVGPDSGVIPLFAGTLVLGTGIGIAQPAVPQMLRGWVSGTVQTSAVVVSLGYISGQLIAAGAAIPVLLPVFGGWRMALLFWAVPALVALAWLLGRPGAGGAAAAQPRAGMSGVLRSRQAWTVAIMMACANLTFFTANSWMAAAAPGGTGSAAAEFDLLALNAAALPVVVVLAAWRRPFVRSRTPYLIAGVATVAGGAGWLAAPGLGPAWAALIGGGSAIAFAGVVAFPATVRDPLTVAPFAALVWTVGCAGAFLGPLLGGVGIDALHWTEAPFVPVALAGVVLMGCAATLPHRDG